MDAVTQQARGFENRNFWTSELPFTEEIQN